MKKIFILFLCVLFVSCAASNPVTRNIEGEIEQFYYIEPEIIFIEKPVYVPHGYSAPSASGFSGTYTIQRGDTLWSLAGRFGVDVRALAEANGMQPEGVLNEGRVIRVPSSGASSAASGIIQPQDYSHAAMVYSYHPDFVYEVYTQPVRVTDICLEPGEAVLEAPFVSDSERWIIGAGVSRENGVDVQHIYIKPSVSGIEATLIINTNRRVYRIILKSFAAVHMPIVRWKYHHALPGNYINSDNSVSNSGGGQSAQTGLNETNAPESHLVSIDPRFLSFDYKIRYGLSKPYWLPEYVFDDGSKTYIKFPLQVLQREMPAVFENRRDILNHRVNGNMVVIDKLVENLTIRIGKKQITVSKTKGKNYE